MHPPGQATTFVQGHIDDRDPGTSQHGRLSCVECDMHEAMHVPLCCRMHLDDQIWCTGVASGVVPL